MTESFFTFPFVSRLCCPLLGRATRQVMWVSSPCLRIEQDIAIAGRERVQLRLWRSVGAGDVGNQRVTALPPTASYNVRVVRGSLGGYRRASCSLIPPAPRPRLLASQPPPLSPRAFGVRLGERVPLAPPGGLSLRRAYWRGLAVPRYNARPPPQPHPLSVRGRVGATGASAPASRPAAPGPPCVR